MGRVKEYLYLVSRKGGVLCAELFTIAVDHTEPTEKLFLLWTAHQDTEMFEFKSLSEMNAAL